MEKFFRRNFSAVFHLCLYALYLKTSPLAENREKFEPQGRLFLPNRPQACSLNKTKVGKLSDVNTSYLIVVTYIVQCFFI